MSPYSEDLRKRVVDAVDQGDGSLRGLARRFCVRVYPERQIEPTIPVETGVHPFGYVPILRCVSLTEPI